MIIIEFCLGMLSNLGKLILFKGSVYNCFMRFGFIYPGMKNRSLQVRFLKSILPAFNR